MERTIEEQAREYMNTPPVKAAIKCGDIEDLESHIKVAFKNGTNWLKSLLLEKLQVYKGAMILDGYEPDDVCIKFMNELIEEINGGEYSSWISVEKRLPPVGTKVLVKTKNGNCLVSSMYVPTDCKGTVLGEKQWKGSGALKDSIVKWRPIPE